MEEFSLDGMDNFMNDEVGEGILSWNKSLNRGPKEENVQPFLMDYFYGQIKLAEWQQLFNIFAYITLQSQEKG